MDFYFCEGYTKPAGSLEELIEALKEKGFVINDLFGPFLGSPDGTYTGFEVDDEETGMLVGSEEMTTASGFHAFVGAIQGLSALIARASFSLKGSESESYEFDGSRWYVELRPRFMVPLDQKSRVLDRLEQVRSEFQQL